MVSKFNKALDYYFLRKGFVNFLHYLPIFGCLGYSVLKSLIMQKSSDYSLFTLPEGSILESTSWNLHIFNKNFALYYSSMF